MSGKSIYNWDTIRKAFVTSNALLKELSREHTGLGTDPKYQTLRKMAARENWDEQRKAFINNLSTEVAATPTFKQVVQRTDQLIDAAEAIARHLQLAKSLQGSYVAIAAKLKQARVIEQMDFSSLDPLQISLVLQRLAALVSSAADIERKALGLSDPEQRVKVDASINASIDFSSMTDGELYRIAAE